MPHAIGRRRTAEREHSRMLAEAAALRRAKGPVAIAPRQVQSAEGTTPSSNVPNGRAASEGVSMACQNGGLRSLPIRFVVAQGPDIDTNETTRGKRKECASSALVKQGWPSKSNTSIPIRYLPEPTFATKQCAALLQNPEVRRIHHYGMLNHLPFARHAQTQKGEHCY